MRTIDAARGKWRGLLSRWIDPEFLVGKHRPCPLCGGTDRFRFLDYKGTGSWVCNNCSPKPQDGMALLIQYTGRTFKELAAEIDACIGVVKQDPVKPEKDYRAILRRVAEGVKRDIRMTPVQWYLRSRGIKTLPANVGYSPACGYYESGERPMPAMVSRITMPSGERVGFHVTFLTLDGKKAGVDRPKKLRGPHPEGAGVYLAPHGDRVVVGEGIETTLAGMEIFGEPGIAALSAGRLATLQVPGQIKHVRILADADESFTGQEAAYSLAKRLYREGKKVSVEVPALGTDFADVIQA